MTTQGKMRVKHLAAKLEGCKRDLLNDKKALSELCKITAKAIDMTIIDETSYKFNPHGVSVVLLLKESHIALHSWPEFGLLDVEIVSCKETSDVFKGLKIIAKAVGAKKIETNFWEFSR